MINKKPSYEELERKLKLAESIIDVIRKGEVDAIVRQNEVSLVRSERSVRHTEDELQKFQAHYLAIIEDQTEMICRYYTDGLLSFVNRSFCDYFKQSQKNLIGKRFKLNVHKDDKINVKNQIKQLNNDKPVINVIFRIYLDEDDLRWLKWTIRAIFLDDKIVEYQAVGVDITKDKNAEIQLKEAKDIAESASRMKTEFLENMSHELRTPLNIILGYSRYYVNDQNIPDNLQDIFKDINKSGEHLLTIINDILDMAQIDMNRITFVDNEFLLIDFLTEIADIINLQAKKKEIIFEFDYDKNLPKIINADEKRLRQILLKLLTNAVKFTDKGGNISFKIECVNDIIRFTIKDSGIGICNELKEKIFLPFHQCKNNRGFTEGIGIGLAICNKLANMMGSEIHFNSTINKGSIFWFDLLLEKIAPDNNDLEKNDNFVSKKYIEKNDELNNEQNNELNIPSKDYIKKLYKMAMTGNIIGIEKLVNDIINLDINYKPFADKINKYANDFKLNELRIFIKNYI